MPAGRTTARRRRGSVGVLALAAVVLVGCAKGPETTQSGYPTATKVSSQETWTRAMCTTVTKARTITRDVFKGVGDEDSLTSAKRRAALVDDLAQQLDGAADEVAALDRTLADAGVPKIADGDAISGRARNGFSGTIGRLHSTAAAVRRVPTEDRQAFERGLRAALEPMEGGGVLLDDLVRSLRLDPSFAAQLDALAACADL